MYGNIALYYQYFSPGAGSNVHKTYFYFSKLTKKYFILLDWKSSMSQKIKMFLFTFPKETTLK